MLTRRLIACLDVRDGAVVKGVTFENLIGAGDPASLAERYDLDGIDELVVLDVTATLAGRLALTRTVERVAARLTVPLTVGGGVRTLEDAAALFDAGADKVAVNSAALAEPGILGELAGRYGSQAVVVAIDAKAEGERYSVFSRSGTFATGRDAVEWSMEAVERGAGEILLTSIDRDGTRIGFDCDLTSRVSDAVPIPVIASGGAGTPAHFVDVFTRGRADAALAASVFHFAHESVASLKTFLRSAGVPVRHSW